MVGRAPARRRRRVRAARPAKKVANGGFAFDLDDGERPARRRLPARLTTASRPRRSGGAGRPARRFPIASPAAEATMADTAQYLTLGLDQELFGIDIRNVREILDMRPISKLPHAPDFLLGMIDVRGAGYPIVDLRTKLGLPRAEPTEATRIIILDVPVNGRTMGRRLRRRPRLRGHRPRRRPDRGRARCRRALEVELHRRHRPQGRSLHRRSSISSA